MSPRPDVSEARKKQIMDAAVVVFARRGFYEARMEDIASEAGLSKGALYWYFDSKDAIISALMEHIFSRETAAMAPLLESDAPAAERLRAVTDYFVRELFDELVDLMPVMYEYYAASMREEPVRTFLQGYLGSYREMLATLVQQGIDRGEFRDDVDAGDAAMMVASLYEGAAFLWFLDPDEVNIESLSETSVRLLLEGLTPRGKGAQDDG